MSSSKHQIQLIAWWLIPIEWSIQTNQGLHVMNARLQWWGLLESYYYKRQWIHRDLLINEERQVARVYPRIMKLNTMETLSLMKLKRKTQLNCTNYDLLVNKISRPCCFFNTNQGATFIGTLDTKWLRRMCRVCYWSCARGHKVAKIRKFEILAIVPDSTIELLLQIFFCNVCGYRNPLWTNPTQWLMKFNEW